MSKAVLVMDMPSSCSKCKFMYEFYGVKKCQLLNILENGGKAIIPTDTLTTGRKECCPLKPMPEKEVLLTYPEYRENDFMLLSGYGF